MDMDFLNYLRPTADHDIEILESKGATYGDSWKKRGGVGAFMMLARKWDRIENQMQAAEKQYDILAPLIEEMKAGCRDGLLDDIADLRRYLMLVEAEARAYVYGRSQDHG